MTTDEKAIYTGRAMIPILAFRPPVIAHRGAMASAPENTLAALRLAHEQGATWVEIDVKITQDGVPILMHDDTLDRTTNGTGFVADSTWEEIVALDSGKWFNPRFAGEPVPHLADALRIVLASGLSIVVEIKPCPTRAQATTMVTLIEMAKIWPDRDVFPMISSFDMESLSVAMQLQPHWPRALLLDTWREDWRNMVDEIQASAITLDEVLLTRERVKELKQAEMPVLCYTVNDPVRAKELLDWGVSAVFADDPRDMIERLK